MAVVSQVDGVAICTGFMEVMEQPIVGAAGSADGKS